MRGNNGRGYETFAQRVRQHEAADVIREAWRCGVWVTPQRPPGLDYELFGPLAAMGEFKGRNVPFGRYPDIQMFVRQWRHLLTNAPAFLFVGFTDGLYYAAANDAAVARYDPHAGRGDRGDRFDKQPSVYIGNAAFAPIERKPEWLI